MSVTYLYRGKEITIIKGASEVLLKECAKYKSSGNIRVLTHEKIKDIEKQTELMAEEALRVILVAYKENEELVFLGLYGIEDAPRKEAWGAVKAAKEAGIIPVMITGDHFKTACAIAKKTGIYEDGKKCITGKELDKMSDEDLTENISEIRVYARVSPMLVPKDHQLSEVNGVFNAILVKGDSIGDVMFYGQGAGKLPTASAVVADVIDAAKHLNINKLLTWKEAETDFLVDPETMSARYFVKANAASVAADFAGAEVLGEADGVWYFVTEKMTEGAFKEKLAGRGGFIRVLEP